MALEDGVSLLNRLRMEGKNSKADVVLGPDNNLLEAATQSKLFAKAGTGQRGHGPGGWDNDTLCRLITAISPLSTTKQAENPPKSLKELVESDQKWRVITKIPHQHPGSGAAAVDAKVYGEQSPEARQNWRRKPSPSPKAGARPTVCSLKGKATGS